MRIMNSVYFFFTFPLPPRFLTFCNEHRFIIRKKCYKITCCNLQGGPPLLLWPGLCWLIWADLGGLLQSDGTKSATSLANPAGDMGLLHHSPWLSFFWRIYFFLLWFSQSKAWAGTTTPGFWKKMRGSCWGTLTHTDPALASGFSCCPGRVWREPATHTLTAWPT